MLNTDKKMQDNASIRIINGNSNPRDSGTRAMVGFNRVITVLALSYIWYSYAN